MGFDDGPGGAQDEACLSEPPVGTFREITLKSYSSSFYNVFSIQFKD